MDDWKVVAAEIIKLGISTAIQQAQQAGMTVEQIDALYNQEKAKLYTNDPANIPG